jgi:hypothetical protein
MKLHLLGRQFPTSTLMHKFSARFTVPRFSNLDETLRD